MSLECLPPSLGLIRLTVREQMSFEVFQDGRHGSHLVYRNGTILAVMDLHVSLMPPTKFQLKLTYSFRGNVVRRIS